MRMFRRNRNNSSDGKQTQRKASGDFTGSVSWPLAMYRTQRRSRDSTALEQSLASISTLKVASVHYSMGAAATGAGLTVQLGSLADSLRHLDLSNLAREGSGRQKNSEMLDHVNCAAVARTLRQCPTLVTLSLAGSSLQDAGLKVLVEAMATEGKDAQLAALEDMDLSRNRLQDGNLLARVVSGHGARRLVSLSLEANQLSDEALVAFSAGLCMCGQLTRLNLARNQIGDRGVEAVAQALEHQRSSPAPMEIAEVASADAMSKWLLSLCVPGLQDMNSSRPGLASLDLSSTLIGDRGAEALAAVMMESSQGRPPALRRINLYDTPIGARGRLAFEKAVKTSHEKAENHSEVVCRALQNAGPAPCCLAPMPVHVQGLRLETLEADFSTRMSPRLALAVPRSSICLGTDSCCSATSSCIDDTECATTIGDEPEEDGMRSVRSLSGSLANPCPARHAANGAEEAEDPDVEAPATRLLNPTRWQQIECEQEVAELREWRIVQQQVSRLKREKAGYRWKDERDDVESSTGSEYTESADKETEPEEVASCEEPADQAASKTGVPTADGDSHTGPMCREISPQSEPEQSVQLQSIREALSDAAYDVVTACTQQGATTSPIRAPVSAADGADAIEDVGNSTQQGATTSPAGVATAAPAEATTSSAGTDTAAVSLPMSVAASKPDIADEAGGSVSPKGTCQCVSSDEATQAAPPSSSPGKGKGKGKGKKGCPPPLPSKGMESGSCSPPRAACGGSEEVQEEKSESKDGALAGESAPPAPKGKGKGKGPAPPAGKGAPPAAASAKGSGKGGPPPPASGKGSKGGPPAPNGKGGSKGGPKGKAPPAEPSVVPFNRKLYWKPLDLRDAEGTIFSEGNPDSARGARGSNPHIDVNALQRMFQGDSQETEKNERSQRLLQKAQGRAEGVKVLDPKRAQNIAIVLRRLRLPTEELASVLQGLRWEHEGVLTEQIEQIQEVLPTPEEAEALAAHRSPEEAAKLRDIERMVLPLSQLKRGKNKLKLINCARSAEAQLEAITRPFAHFRDACDAIQGSEMLREVLLIALDVGNYINHGNLQHSRAARAISIGSLLQFRDFKTGRMSSLHFFCAQLYSADASRDSAAVLENELRPVISAAKQQLQSVLLAVAAFEQDLKMIQAECQAAADYDDDEEEKAGSPGSEEDAEVVNVQDLRGSARSRLLALRRVVAKYGEQLNADKERTIAQVRDTLRFCGVSVPASKQPLLEFEPFMGQLAEFVNIFANHWHEVKSDLPKYSKFFPALQEVCRRERVADGDMAAGKARAGGGAEKVRRRRCSI